MKRSARALYDPSIEYFRNLSDQYRKEDSVKVLFRALVSFVDRYGDTDRPRYSIRAKVYGIDSPQLSDTADDRLFPPLFSIHQLSIPEVGEEVLIICEEPGNLNTGYWISRRNESNDLNKFEAGKFYPEDPDSAARFRWGQDQLPKEQADNSQPDVKDIPISRVKPGDTVSHGRSNSKIVHSFDSSSKKGYIELVTEETAQTNLFENDLSPSNGSRVLISTNTNADKIITDTLKLNFDGDFSGNKNLNSAYLLLESIQLRLLSRNGGKVQSAVLGEEQARWLSDLLSLIGQIINTLNTHIHSTPNGPSGPSQSPATDTTSSLKSKIKDHHSKTTALN